MRGKLRFFAIAALCGRVIAHPDEYDSLTQIMVGLTVAGVVTCMVYEVVKKIYEVVKNIMGGKNNK